MAILAGKLASAARGLRCGLAAQVDAEPARAQPAAADPLSQDQPRCGDDRAAAGRPVRRGASPPAEADHPRSRRHRRPAARLIRRAGSSHGYYDCYCYLPLYVFCGRHLLAAKLRKADIDASAGAVEEPSPASSAQIRARWPHTRILLRADSGFAREALMACVRGQPGRLSVRSGAQRPRLAAMIERELAAAKAAAEASADISRCAASRSSRGPRWTVGRASAGSSPRRNGRKASANPRFVVTSLSREETRRPASLRRRSIAPAATWRIRIKECQADLFADRTSTATMRANQLRLWFASFAYILLCAVRRIGLKRTQFAKANCATIRLKLLNDRRAGANLGPPHQARHGLILPQPARIPDRPRPARR